MEDLKYLVIDALDKNGSLDSIRAQLRSSIFSAIQSEQSKLATAETEAHKALATPEGEAAAVLFKDFCEVLGLQHTLNVFLPECKNSNLTKKSPVLEQAGVAAKPDIPMIYQLINAVKATGGRASIEEEIDYEEDFEESLDLPGSLQQQRESLPIGESVGSSMGVDASVDSTALEGYDFVEKVRRIN